MIKTLLPLPFLLLSVQIYAQPNCEAYKYYYQDTVKYHACKKAEQITEFYQFSKEYQQILDEAIAIDPTFAYAYRKKSTAYLKSGDFITWKRLMDKAVEHNPMDNLEYRGLMRFKCFRDYDGALRDFAELEKLGYPTDQLSVSKALCLYYTGHQENAIQILEEQVIKDENSLGLEGYIHLGYFYLENGLYAEAIQSLIKQIEIYDLAENHFYLALAYKAINEDAEYRTHLKEAKRLYEKEMRMSDDYIDSLHKIYMRDIKEELVETAIERTDQ